MFTFIRIADKFISTILCVLFTIFFLVIWAFSDSDWIDFVPFFLLQRSGRYIFYFY